MCENHTKKWKRKRKLEKGCEDNFKVDHVLKKNCREKEGRWKMTCWAHSESQILMAKLFTWPAKRKQWPSWTHYTDTDKRTPAQLKKGNYSSACPSTQPPSSPSSPAKKKPLHYTKPQVYGSFRLPFTAQSSTTPRGQSSHMLNNKESVLHTCCII